MKDMVLKADTSLTRMPVALVARSFLASHSSVRAVMALGDDGRILAYERTDCDEYEDDEDEGKADQSGYSLLLFASAARVLFYLRLSQSTSEEVRKCIDGVLGSPPSVLVQ